MEDQYQHTTNGQAVYEEDLNLLGENSALADDRLLAELLRLRPFSSGSPAKAILPYRVSGIANLEGPTFPGQAIVLPGTGGVTVKPFRAVLGSRAVVGSGVKANWRDLRSAILVGSSALETTVSLDTTGPAEYRWDLVYAAVTPDAASTPVARKVKSPTTGQVATVDLSTRKSTAIVLGVVKGVANDLTPPSLPADGGGTYYLPLAYVRLPQSFGGATVLDRDDIWEWSPQAPISEAFCAASLRIADQNWRPDGTVQTRTAWNWTQRKPAHVPSTMVGQEGLIIPVDLYGTGGAPSHNTGDVVDASRDWTKRLFKWTVFATSGTSTPYYPWEGTATAITPSANGILGASLLVGMGQSMEPDLTGNFAVAKLNSSVLTELAATSTIDFYVDATTGELKVAYTNSPNVKLLLWLEATGQYPHV